MRQLLNAEIEWHEFSHVDEHQYDSALNRNINMHLQLQSCDI